MEKMPIFQLDNKHNGSFILTGTDSDMDSDSVPESVSDNVNEP